MKRILLLVFICTIYPYYVYSQGEFETAREPEKYSLNSFGAKLNSNGFGLYYSFSQSINYRLRRFYEFEYDFVKDPKEIKVVSQLVQQISPRNFVYGKLISAHNFKVGYGYNRMIFEKRDKNSISIHLLGSLGVSLCVGKPIYYEHYSRQDSATYIDKFDINEQSNNENIIGKGPIYKGFDELKLHPGFYAKFGIAFDFSRDIMLTNVLETGIAVDAYLKPVEIMAGNKRRSFISLYVMYSFGKKYDPRINREFRREQRKLERKNPQVEE